MPIQSQSPPTNPSEALPIKLANVGEYHGPGRHVETESKSFRGKQGLDQPLREQDLNGLLEDRQQTRVMDANASFQQRQQVHNLRHDITSQTHIPIQKLTNNAQKTDIKVRFYLPFPYLWQLFVFLRETVNSIGEHLIHQFLLTGSIEVELRHLQCQGLTVPPTEAEHNHWLQLAFHDHLHHFETTWYSWENQVFPSKQTCHDANCPQWRASPPCFLSLIVPGLVSCSLDMAVWKLSSRNLPWNKHRHRYQTLIQEAKLAIVHTRWMLYCNTKNMDSILHLFNESIVANASKKSYRMSVLSMQVTFTSCETVQVQIL